MGAILTQPPKGTSLRGKTVAATKNLNFQNPRWRTATILKKNNCNCLTNFEEIWHDDASRRGRELDG